MPALIGEAVDRVDGRLKVTGKATYAGEFRPPGPMCHAVLVSARIGKGSVKSIDTSAAMALPGVVQIYTSKNFPGLKEVPPLNPGSKASQTPGAPLMIKDQIIFYGQYVAIVLAETLDVARHAADTIKVQYAPQELLTSLAGNLVAAHPPDGGKAKDEKADTKSGDVEKAAASADFKISNIYSTPNENHNPMEMHATVAAWEGGKLTIWDATQGISMGRTAIAAAVGVDEENVRVICPFVGGGFGCKGTTWPHAALTAMTARLVGRPVRMMLTRAQMFYGVGYRSRTRQTIALSAKANGILTSISHDVISQSPKYSEFLETSALSTRMLYACENVATTHRLVDVDTHQPTYMRAPGESTGVFALEVAMDEMAHALKIDPLELRILNYATKDVGKDKPFSSKSLMECYKQGAERFGWEKRDKTPGKKNNAGMLVGYGMATATYPTNRMPSAAVVQVYADGSVIVKVGTQDLGTGTYTIMAQIVADGLGLPVTAVQSQLGDSLFPKSGISGGSMTAAGVGSAVADAVEKLKKDLIETATSDEKSPVHGLDAEKVKISNGAVISIADPAKSDSIRSVVARTKKNVMESTGGSKPGPEKKEYSSHAFGAVFVEVNVDPTLGTVKVARVVAAYAAGKILNSKTARSQFLGGLVFAHGMALLEETITDPRTGMIVNANLADYMVPVNADIQSFEIIQVPEIDTHVNPLGVKGIGEIGIVGAPAAIVNAIFDATGKRVRDLPVTPEKLI